MESKPKPQQINVELGEKEAEGIYSNLVMISHSSAECIMDFTRMLPGTPKAKVFARIIMTPQHAKSFLHALQDNLKKYEKQFGEINIHRNDNQKSHGFQSGSNNNNNKDISS